MALIREFEDLVLESGEMLDFLGYFILIEGIQVVFNDNCRL